MRSRDFVSSIVPEKFHLTLVHFFLLVMFFVEVWNVSPKHSLSLLCIELASPDGKQSYQRYWCQDEKMCQEAPHHDFLPRWDHSSADRLSLSNLLDLFLKTPGVITLQTSFKEVYGKQNSAIARATLREGSRNMLLLFHLLQCLVENNPTQYHPLREKQFILQASPIYLTPPGARPAMPAGAGVPVGVPTASHAFLALIRNQTNLPLVFINVVPHRHPLSDRCFTTIQFQKFAGKQMLLSKSLSLYPAVPPFLSSETKSHLAYLKFLHSLKRMEHSSFQNKPIFHPKDQESDQIWIETHLLKGCVACYSHLEAWQ